MNKTTLTLDDLPNDMDSMIKFFKANIELKLEEKKSGGGVNYKEFTVKRKLENNKTMSFFLELPEFHSKMGVTSFTDNVNDKYIKAYLTTPEQQKFRLFLDSFHKFVAENYIYPMRISIGMKDYHINNRAAMFKLPFYEPTDDDGKVIEDKSAIFDFKLNKHVSFPTKFYKPDRSSFSDDMVRNGFFDGKSLKFYPCILIRSVYIGAAKASIQISMKSAVITSVTENEQKCIQENTINKINTENPNATEELEKQIEKLRALLSTLENKQGENKTNDGSEKPPSPSQAGPAVSTPTPVLEQKKFPNFGIRKT